MPNRNVYFSDYVDRKLTLLAIQAEKHKEEKNTPTLIAAEIVTRYIDQYTKKKEEEWNEGEKT